MKRKIAHLIFLFLIISLAAACKSESTEIGPTPDITGFGNTPRAGGYFPEVLDCSVIPDVAMGVGTKWNGLRIGRSTYEDVYKKLEPKKVYWDSYYGNVVFSTGSPPLEEIAVACFYGNILSAIQVDGIHFEEFNLELDEFLEIYGKPDRVTWGSKRSTADRMMVWAEEGMYAIVSHSWGDNAEPDYIVNVTFFPPIPLEELEDSWLMQSISPPPLPTGEEDWWGFNDE